MTVTFLLDNDVHPRLYNSVEIKPGQLYFLRMLRPSQATWQMFLRFNKFFKLLGSWCSSFQCHHREQEIKCIGQEFLQQLETRQKPRLALCWRHTQAFLWAEESSWPLVQAFFQSMTLSKMSHLEQLGSRGQPEGWVHVWWTSQWHLFSPPSLSVDGKVSPSTLSIGSALTLPSSLTSNSAAMLDFTSSLKAFMDGGEYLIHHQSLLALCVCFPKAFHLCLRKSSRDKEGLQSGEGGAGCTLP